MTIIRSLLLLAALSPAAIMLSSCAKTDNPPSTAAPDSTAIRNGLATAKAAAADTWENIQGYAFEKRADFAAALDRMADKSDAGIRAMNAKLTGLPDAAAKAQDSAGKEFAEALASLKVQTASLRAATVEAWADAKEKTAQSWRRVEAAYAKLNAGPAT